MTQPFYPQTTSQEVVFYQDASPVYISSTRAIFFNETFVTESIVSVSIGEVTPPRNGEIAVILSGLVLTLLSCVLLTSSKLTTTGIMGLVILFLFSIGLLILGLFRYLNASPHHALIIGSPAGQSKVVVSPDPSYITTLQNALNQALLSNNHSSH